MNTIPTTGPIASFNSSIDSAPKNQVNTTLNNNPAPSNVSVNAMEMRVNQPKNTNNSNYSAPSALENAQSSSAQSANLINFRKDNSSQKAVIEIKDKESGKVKYQIPPEVSLRISNVIQNSKGENIDQSV